MIRRLHNIQRPFTTLLNILTLMWQAQPLALFGIIFLNILQGLLPFATAWVTKLLFDLLAQRLGKPTCSFSTHPQPHLMPRPNMNCMSSLSIWSTAVPPSSSPTGSAPSKWLTVLPCWITAVSLNTAPTKNSWPWGVNTPNSTPCRPKSTGK